MLQENFSTNFTNKPLVAVVRDASGNPISGVSVSFQVTQGSGTIFPGPQGTTTGGGAGTQVTMTTDANGQASVHFTSSLISPGSSYAQTTIQASTAAQTVNFIMTTVLLSVGGQQAPLPVVQLVTPTLDNLTVTGRAGDTIPGAIKVRVIVAAGAQGGQGIPNVGVRLNSGDPTLGLPTATCAGAAGRGRRLFDYSRSGHPADGHARRTLGVEDHPG